MSTSTFIVLLVSLVTQFAAKEPPASASRPQVATLWRGTLAGDSIFVRATWIPTRGASQCVAFMGDMLDSAEVRPKYLDYRIQGARARTLLRDEVSGEYFGVCVDDMSAESVAWRDGLQFTVTAVGWGCEPAGNCELKRYIHVPDSGHIAMSEWTDLTWDPLSPALLDGEVDDRCLTYSMTLAPELRDSIIVFTPTFAAGVKENDLLERPVTDDVPDRCRRHGAARSPMRVDWFPTPAASTAEQRLVRAEDRLEIESVVVRAVREAGGVLRPAVFRVGVALNGQHGFMTREAMRSLGFDLV